MYKGAKAGIQEAVWLKCKVQGCQRELAERGKSIQCVMKASAGQVDGGGLPLPFTLYYEGTFVIEDSEARESLA